MMELKNPKAGGAGISDSEAVNNVQGAAAPVTCFRCGKPGHISPKCSFPKNSPVILWFDLGLIAREGFSNVSYSKKCDNILFKSLKKFSEGKHRNESFHFN